VRYKPPQSKNKIKIGWETVTEMYKYNNIELKRERPSNAARDFSRGNDGRQEYIYIKKNCAESSPPPANAYYNINYA